MTLTDEQLEEFIEQELQKDITQEDTIDEADLEFKLGGMGWLWDRVNNKLGEDGICFKCKKKVDFSGGKMSVLEANKVDKGVVAFVAVCEDCKKEIGEK